MKKARSLEIFCAYRNGMVLLMALWILSILSVFALFIGVGVRQKLVLVSRIERRDEIHYAGRSAVQAARSVFVNMPDEKSSVETVMNKQFRHNNPLMFQTIFAGESSAEVRWHNYDQGLNSPVVFYGLQDELGKLNINYASLDELQRLFILTAGLDYEIAQDLAAAIVDWRTEGDRQLFGFYGDEYYSNLNFPYESKRKLFELLEELLLVKGMNPDIFSQSKEFLTVYGAGRVNINTASRPVLTALGISPDVVDIMIFGRNGEDQIFATEDDYIFRDGGMSLNLSGFLPLKPEELAQIDELYTQKKIAAVSHFFRIKVKAVLMDGQETRFIDCVIQSPDAKILSWREY